MSKIVIATRSEETVTEIAKLLKPLNVEVVSLLSLDFPEAIKVLDFINENGVFKASKIANIVGEACLCDDIGLSVDQLSGRPGLLSSGFVVNNDYEKAMDDILTELNDCGSEDWNAGYYCILSYAAPLVSLEEKQIMEMFVGNLRGYVLPYKIGKEGYGFDRFFAPNGYGQSLAQFQEEERYDISCVSDATKKFMEYYEAQW